MTDRAIRPGDRVLAPNGTTGTVYIIDASGSTALGRYDSGEAFALPVQTLDPAPVGL